MSISRSPPSDTDLTESSVLRPPAEDGGFQIRQRAVLPPKTALFFVARSKGALLV